MLIKKEKSVTLTSANLKVKLVFTRQQGTEDLKVEFNLRHGLQRPFNDFLALVMAELGGHLQPLFDATPAPKQQSGLIEYEEAAVKISN